MKETSLIGISIETIITSVVIPIFAFFLGLIVTRINAKWNSIKTAKSHQAYFLTWAKLILERAQKQSVAISEYAFQITNIESNPQYETYNLHTDKIKEISKIELYNALFVFRKERAENKEILYYKAINIVEYFARKTSECLELTIRFRETEKQLNNQWAEGLQEINNLRLQFFNEKRDQIEKDPFLMDFYKIHENMLSLEETKANLHEYYLIPLNNMFNQYLNSSSQDPRTVELTKINNKLLSLYLTMLNHRERISKVLISRHEQLERSIQDLLDVTSKLRKMRFKNIFNSIYR